MKHYIKDKVVVITGGSSGFGLESARILLGTVAARIPNTKLQWDAEKMDITNVPEARKYLSRTYRTGW